MTTKVQSNSDGSSSILNGVVEAIHIATDGKVAFPQMAQSWQDVIGNRSLGQPFVNDTNQNITISLLGSSLVVSASLLIKVNSVIVGYSSPVYSAGEYTVGTFVVPVGATYQIEANVGAITVTGWWELR
jgi:hypothetical protein